MKTYTKEQVEEMTENAIAKTEKSFSGTFKRLKSENEELREVNTNLLTLCGEAFKTLIKYTELQHETLIVGQKLYDAIKAGSKL